MALRPALDLELLRTLVFIAEEASFTKAADRVGRTQSAVTLQVQKLESLVGQTLVVRSKGGPVELTPRGRALVENARAMLKLNDEALRAMADEETPTTVRLGVTSTYISCFVEETLKSFRERFPSSLVEVIEGNSCQLAPQLRDGALDLALCTAGHEPRGWPSLKVAMAPLRWITSIEHAPHLRDPLPLCLVPAHCPWLPAWLDDCIWRSVAMRVLAAAGRRYQIVASASSFTGLYAPVLAGQAVTLSFPANLPPGLRAIDDDEGFPPLPDDEVIVIKSRNAVQPHTDALAEAILENFRLN